jgi:G3E family GTPase
MTIPVTILTGFLGSGKTTLLNRLLAENTDENVAVIINEFGDTSIDNHLVMTTSEEILEINSGCICCNVRQDLIRLLQNIKDRHSAVDRVIIETTGMADPAPIIQTFLMDERTSDTFEIDSIITMIDSKHIFQHLHEDEVKSQVAFADILLMNKTDLISEVDCDKLKETLRHMNPTAEYFTTHYGNAAVSDLMGRYTFNLNHVLDIAPSLQTNEYHHHHNHQITSVVLREDHPLDIDKVNEWFSALITLNGENLYRYKGILNIKGTRRKIIFQGVHMTFAGMEGLSWQEDEEKKSEFVFIGKDLNYEVLEKGIRYCHS